MTDMFATNGSPLLDTTSSMDVVESGGSSPSLAPMKEDRGIFVDPQQQQPGASSSAAAHAGVNSVSEDREEDDEDVRSHRSSIHSNVGSLRAPSEDNSSSDDDHGSRGNRRRRSRSRGELGRARVNTGDDMRRDVGGSGGGGGGAGGGSSRHHRRGGGGGGSTSLSPKNALSNNGRLSSSARERSRSRDRRDDSSSSINNHNHNRQRSRSGTGSSNNSLSPRSRGRCGGIGPAAGAAAGAAPGARSSNGELKMDNSPKRRRGGGGGGGGGSPRPGDFDLEPSKVLHVRNVGHPVTQGDLLSLLSCFGPVEKIKMFSGQALVQLPSVSIAKATMRHFEEDEEAKIGSKRVYINYSRSRSIEPRDGEGGGGGGGGGGSNNGHGLGMNGLIDLGRIGGGGSVGGSSGGTPRGGGIPAGLIGLDGNGNGAGAASQDPASPYAHLIMEDHAKLLSLATFYLQTYMLPGGEGAVININRREEMADYQRHAMHAMGMNGGGGNGHAHAHTHSLAGWNGNTATTAAASRLPGNMPPVGGFNPGYSGRPRSGSRGLVSDFADRSQQQRRPLPR